jgi:hypothetical protein
MIDDWGLVPSKEQERRDLLEVLKISSRSSRIAMGHGSTIMTSQPPPAK